MLSRSDGDAVEAVHVIIGALDGGDCVCRSTREDTGDAFRNVGFERVFGRMAADAPAPRSLPFFLGPRDDFIIEEPLLLFLGVKKRRLAAHRICFYRNVSIAPPIVCFCFF